MQKMYTASSAKNEKIVNVMEQYRPTSSINFSDIVEDGTIYSNHSLAIDTAEISGRVSTWGNDQSTIEPEIDPNAVSVDDILGNSIVQEIRHMSQSRQPTLSTSIRNRHSSSQFRLRSDDISCISAEFRPAEEMHDQLNQDEKDWEQECCDIPQTNRNSMSVSEASSSKKPAPKLHAKLAADMTDFSMAYFGDSISSTTDMSIGRFFSNRCPYAVRDMIPAKSPTKHVPIALVSNSIQSANTDSELYSQASSSFYADDESNSNAAPKISTKTYDKERSVLSVSSIASHLEDNIAESPQTFLENLRKNKGMKSMSKPLTKSNVQLLEKTLNEQAQTSNKLNGKQQIRPAMNQEYQMDNQYQHPNNNAIDMQNRFNSTKIEEQTNEWVQSKGTASTETAVSFDGMTTSSNISLENSGCSPIKSLSPSEKPIENGINGGKSKRRRSPNPIQSNGISSPPDNDKQWLQKENTENKNDKNTAVPRRMRSTGDPLNDMSSILNNLQIKSPPTRDESKSPKPAIVRKSQTDLKSTQIESRSNNEQRQYVNQNRSSDFAKMSLPSYGLQGIRTSYQSSIPLDKRCNSQMSTHSEFTQQDGKFPLKSNSSELVWECIKLRKSVTKSFVIKNTSEKKLGLKIIVVGPGFQIVSGIESDSVVLQGHECRTINVAFCPTVTGKAIGKIIFKPTRNWSEETERSVYLWAYGGSTTLQLKGIERGPVGSSFLKMGETSTIKSSTLIRSFSIYNKGPLNGVATIFIKPKTNQCINESHILIEPNKCVIRPECSSTITVSYKLRRKDLERLREPSCEVLTIGTLEVIFGSEPNRQRISSMLTRGSMPTMYKQLEFLINDFPVASMENFSDFREHQDNVSELFGCFKTSEIALTINRTNLDETQDADLSWMDDSDLFRTLIETPRQDQVTSQPRVDYLKSENHEMLEAYPKRLSMDTRHNSRKSIIVQSLYTEEKTFEVNCQRNDYFKFSTTSGKIKPRGEYIIEVELKKNIHIMPFSDVIRICFEMGLIEIPISVQPLPHEYGKY